MCGLQTAMTIRESIYTGSYLGLCPVLKGYLDDRDLLQDYPASSSLVLSGITAGLFAAFATQPIDTAKTRQQAFLDSKVFLSDSPRLLLDPLCSPKHA